MVNQSKKTDSRYWMKWRDSGAVGTTKFKLTRKQRQAGLIYNHVLKRLGGFISCLDLERDGPNIKVHVGGLVYGHVEYWEYFETTLAD